MPHNPSRSKTLAPPAPPQPFTDWLSRVTEQPQGLFQAKLRGNVLHVLCESNETLNQQSLLTKLVTFLWREGGKTELLNYYPQLYQIYLHNRIRGEHQPIWTASIYLDRLEKHWAHLVLEAQDPADVAAAQALLSDPTLQATTLASMGKLDSSNSAIVLSNLSLARQGKPEAIAWYLSEILSALDVGVWVSVKAFPGVAHVIKHVVTVADRPAAVASDPTLADSSTAPEPVEADVPRLWVVCEAAYSPDPVMIAEPTAQRLRDLQLTQFRDAVILIRVQGEDQPDWLLRIDLTPQEEMLKEWARWGDVDAIARLLNRTLAPAHLKVTTELKEASLHIACQPLSQALMAEATPTALPATPDAVATVLPNQATVLELITPLLDGLGPQGLHRAVVYGQQDATATPDWVAYLDLPAAEHPALAPTTRELASEPDLPALAYVLTRTLNPNLDVQLTTGGLRVQLLDKDHLLHVMVDGPVCPARQAVVAAVRGVLNDLQPQRLEGMRIYGRRSGQQRPTWSYGTDFQKRSRIVPEATVDFAASASYVGDLLAYPEEQIFRPEMTADGVRDWFRALGNRLLETSQFILLRTHLFEPLEDSLDLPTAIPHQLQAGGGRIALVWGAVGLLLAFQLDWVLGQVLSPTHSSAASETTPELVIEPPEAVAPAPADLTGSTADVSLAEDPANEWDDLKFGRQDPQEGSDTFASDGFTQDPAQDGFGNDSRLTSGRIAVDSATPPQGTVNTTDLLAESPYPSFRSQQLDEKLALYHQRLQESGPVDVLVIGSSRALRGIDPAALRRSLAALGYENVSIFNFGINGATAQVVDLTLRRILTEDQLPQLIVWADGARAFNSGRVDITYNAIATSEGYRELIAGRLHDRDATSETPEATAEVEETAATTALTFPETLRQSYQTMDRWLSDSVGQLSAVYGERENLKTLMQITASTALGGISSAEQAAANLNALDPEGLDSQTYLIDFDGFLSLSEQFNPATYYQNHARVPGDYDGDYEDFKLEGRQSRAFENLLAFTQAKGIPIVFINTPLTDEYLDAYRQTAEDEFLRYMLRISTTESDFIFRDLAQIWPTQYDYFSDPSHLNRYGAYQVSNRIAQDPMIPWPQPRSKSQP